MKTTFVSSCLMLLVFAGAKAQTLQDAIRKTMNERYESAADDFTKLRQSQPANGEVLFYSGDNYFYWEQTDSASMMYTEGAKAAPSNPLNYAGLGKIAVSKGDLTKADEYFTKAISLMTVKGNTVDKNTQVTTYVKMAESYIQAKTKSEQALAYIQSAVKINPANPEIYIQWGDLNLANSSSNLTAAIDMYEDSYEKDPKYTRALLRQGQLWVRVQKYDMAAEWFEKAIAQDPTFAPAYREKAELNFLIGKNKIAIEAYEKYLELNDDLSARSRYAKFLVVNKQYDLALTEIEKVMQVDSSDCILYRLKAYSQYELSKFPEGLSSINKYFSCAQNTGKYTIVATDYAYRGKLNWKLGSDSLAVIDLKEAIRMKPDFADPYGDLAAVYFKMKKYPEAAEYYNQKISRSAKPVPTDISSLGQAYYRIAESMKEIVKTDSTRIEEQLTWYKKADEQFSLITVTYPVFANAWRGRCNSKLDNPEAPVGLAKPFYELAISKAVTPKDIEQNKKDLMEAYSYLGFFHYTQKNYDCSKVAWLKVQELDPVNEKAAKALEDADISAAAGTCQLIVQ